MKTLLSNNGEDGDKTRANKQRQKGNNRKQVKGTAEEAWKGSEGKEEDPEKGSEDDKSKAEAGGGTNGRGVGRSRSEPQITGANLGTRGTKAEVEGAKAAKIWKE